MTETTDSSQQQPIINLDVLATTRMDTWLNWIADKDNDRYEAAILSMPNQTLYIMRKKTDNYTDPDQRDLADEHKAAAVYGYVVAVAVAAIIMTTIFFLL